MHIGLFELLKGMGDGRVLDDMQNRLVEVLAAVRQCHKKGKVVLTIDVHPTDASEVQRVEIEGSVTYKLPLPGRGSELYYVDDDLTMHKRDPRQRQLPNMIPMPEISIDGKSRAAGERPS